VVDGKQDHMGAYSRDREPVSMGCLYSNDRTVGFDVRNSSIPICAYKESSKVENKMRSVSADFVLAMEEKLQHGREMGRTGWDSHWEIVSVDAFILPNLLDKLDEEVAELVEVVNELRLTGGKQNEVRLEAADVANIAMMIADMAGVLNDE